MIPLAALFYLFLPAAFANMAPVLCRGLPLLDVPLDGGLKIGGRALLGKQKTVRGVVAGILFAVAMALIQHLLLAVPFFSDLSLVPYADFMLVGVLLGGGAMLGDLIESAIKRRLGIVSSRPWIPFDQIDWVIGAFLLLEIAYPLPWLSLVPTLALFFVLHIAVKHVGYWLHLDTARW